MNLSESPCWVRKLICWALGRGGMGDSQFWNEFCDCKED